MVFSLFYQSLLFILFCLYSPKIAYDYFFKKKYRKSFFQRFGKNFQLFRNCHQPLIWIHAVSVGETKAISGLVKLLKEKHPNVSILISSITETGHQEALRSLSEADYHIYLPFDFSIFIKPLLKKFQPSLVILSEGDVWWNFLRHAALGGAQIGIVNAKLSERSGRRLNYLPFIGRKIYENINFCCCQTDEYAIRFKALGIPKVSVTGNTKFDFELDKNVIPFISEGETIILGSTHKGEEEILISNLAPLLERDFKIVIAPRHPERFDSVSHYLQKMDIPFIRYSEGISGNWKVLLLDAMGLLNHAYMGAKLAIIGGSFIPGIGGHNIVEPCLLGTPVLFGPYMHSQKEMVGLIENFGAGKQITSGEIYPFINHLLSCQESLNSLMTGCNELSKNIKGASQRTYETLSPLVKQFDNG